MLLHFFYISEEPDDMIYTPGLLYLLTTQHFSTLQSVKTFMVHVHHRMTLPPRLGQSYTETQLQTQDAVRILLWGVYFTEKLKRRGERLKCVCIM